MSQAFKVLVEGKQMLEQCKFAKSFKQRAFGLIPYKELPAGHGLMFEGSCQQMHSLFMKFPIELLFLDKEDRILKVELLKPWRFSSFQLKAKKVIEVPVGTAKRYSLESGKKLEVQR